MLYPQTIKDYIVLQYSERGLKLMNELLWNLILGIVAGIISGLITGYMVSFRTMKYDKFRDMHNYGERTLHKLDSIIDELQTFDFSDESIHNFPLKN